MLSNAYFLAKFRFDTAENEPAKNLQNFANFPNFADHARERFASVGMMDILLTAAGIGARKPVTAAMLPEYEFYDVGTGSGKFPVFAALLGMTAVGSGLDQSRLKA